MECQSDSETSPNQSHTSPQRGGVSPPSSSVYVANVGGESSTVGKYTTFGATVDASLISGLVCPAGLALDGTGNLFVSSIDRVGEYTVFGSSVNPNLISGGYNSGLGLALDDSGRLLWASNYGGEGGDLIGEYTTSGLPLNGSFITGLHNPVAVVVVPEPSAPGLLAPVVALMLLGKSNHEPQRDAPK